MTKTIAVIGALDTKGPDIQYIREEILKLQFTPLVIDTSVIGSHSYPREVQSEQLAEAAGETLTALRERGDRGYAMKIMQTGAKKVLRTLFDGGKICAVLGIGGGAGTSVAAAAMRELPIGIPKVMVSTLASGETGMYVQDKDIVMIPSIVDITGVNRISSGVYSRAVGAVAGMVQAVPRSTELKPLLAASMFGNTTKIVQRCKERVEREGQYEVLVFHATGTGGKTMESLVREGHIRGVMDITITEIADEVAGGVMSAGAERLEAAGNAGIPQVIVPGCVDMVNFWGIDTVPPEYRTRRLYSWNPDVTLMRTEPEENAEIGKIIAEKANRAVGPVAVFLPLKGVSLLDAPGKDFWYPEADRALFSELKDNLSRGIEIIEMDNNINDDIFADAVALKFLQMLR